MLGHSYRFVFARVVIPTAVTIFGMNNPVARRVWKVLTWRWRLQLAINAPFAVLWVADRCNPTIHAFDLSVLTALHAEWLAPIMGIA